VAHPFLEHDGPLAIATWPMPRPAGPPSERSSPLQHVLGRRNATLPITPRSSTAGSSLRWLRVVSGPIEVVEVVRHDLVVSDHPDDDQGGGTGQLGEGARMADPRRMTPEEHGEAHALLVKAVTEPDWQAASQALDELMGKLVVLHRLLEAEERLPQRTPRRNG
jgi:hypothetical protein